MNKQKLGERVRKNVDNVTRFSTYKIPAPWNLFKTFNGKEELKQEKTEVPADELHHFAFKGD